MSTYPFASYITYLIKITNPLILNEDERVPFRGTTSIRWVYPPQRSYHPDHHQGLAITGYPCRSTLDFALR